MLISNVHEIYVDNPHFLLFQSYNKRYKSVFILFLAILGLKQFLMHKASLITTNHMNRKKFIKKMCPCKKRCALDKVLTFKQKTLGKSMCLASSNVYTVKKMCSRRYRSQFNKIEKACVSVEVLCLYFLKTRSYINIQNQGKRQSSKIVRFFLTYNSLMYGYIKPSCLVAIIMISPSLLLSMPDQIRVLKQPRLNGSPLPFNSFCIRAVMSKLFEM